MWKSRNWSCLHVASPKKVMLPLIFKANSKKVFHEMRWTSNSFLVPPHRVLDQNKTLLIRPLGKFLGNHAVGSPSFPLSSNTPEAALAPRSSCRLDLCSPGLAGQSGTCGGHGQLICVCVEVWSWCALLFLIATSWEGSIHSFVNLFLYC